MQLTFNATFACFVIYLTLERLYVDDFPCWIARVLDVSFGGTIFALLCWRPLHLEFRYDLTNFRINLAGDDLTPTVEHNTHGEASGTTSARVSVESTTIAVRPPPSITFVLRHAACFGSNWLLVVLMLPIALWAGVMAAVVTVTGFWPEFLSNPYAKCENLGVDGVLLLMFLTYFCIIVWAARRIRHIKDGFAISKELRITVRTLCQRIAEFLSCYSTGAGCAW